MHIKGLAAARERVKPRLTPEAVALKLGVTSRTITRWEETGWVKLRYVADLEKLYGVRFPEAHADDEGPSEPPTAIGAVRPRPGPAPVDDAAVFTDDDIDAFATMYNEKALAGATNDDLGVLHAALTYAVRSQYQHRFPDEDPQTLDDLVYVKVKRKLQPSESVRRPVAVPVQRRKRRP